MLAHKIMLFISFFFCLLFLCLLSKYFSYVKISSIRYRNTYTNCAINVAETEKILFFVMSERFSCYSSFLLFFFVNYKKKLSHDTILHLKQQEEK